MNQLVAIVAVQASAFVTRLRAAWDDGDAVLPVDPRLAPPAAAALLEAMAPAWVVDADGNRTERGAAMGVAVEPGDALVVATSGSTGTPKGVILTHAAVRASAEATAAALGADPSRDHWLACLPLAHIGGLSVVCRALHTGVPCTVAPFDPDHVDAAPDTTGATLVSLVATALARIDARRWRRILVGGSSLPADLPPNVVRTYGMTETGSGVVYDGLALPGVEVRADAAGQLWVRGPMLLRAYRDHTPAGRDPRAADGWYATGDLGGIGADGRVFVTGRAADVIVTGGEKVWPEPIERILAAVAGVADVAVGARPDPEWGQRVVAFVVPADPRRPPALVQLRDAVKAGAAAYCAPKELVLVERIPRTALGKVARRQLPPGPLHSPG